MKLTDNLVIFFFSNTRESINLIEILSTECLLLNGLSDTEWNGKSIQINQKKRERGEGTGQTDRQTERRDRDRQIERKRIAS